jgi:hypothetical protein
MAEMDVDALYQPMYRELTRLVPPKETLRRVEPLTPRSLPEGERRLKSALAEQDWLTAYALAKGMAHTADWRGLPRGLRRARGLRVGKSGTHHPGAA